MDVPAEDLWRTVEGPPGQLLNSGAAVSPYFRDFIRSVDDVYQPVTAQIGAGLGLMVWDAASSGHVAKVAACHGGLGAYDQMVGADLAPADLAPAAAPRRAAPRSRLL